MIKVHFQDGFGTVIFKDIYSVPDLANRPSSVRAFVQMGNVIQFTDYSCELIWYGKSRVNGQSWGELYDFQTVVIVFPECANSALGSPNSVNLTVWRPRMCLLATNSVHKILGTNIKTPIQRCGTNGVFGFHHGIAPEKVSLVPGTRLKVCSFPSPVTYAVKNKAV